MKLLCRNYLNLILLVTFFSFSINIYASALNINTVLERSKTLAAQKDYDQALALLQQAAQAYPDSIDIQLAIARVLAWKGDYPAANKLLAQLLSNYPNHPDIELTQAYNLYYQSKYTESANLFQKILHRYPHYEDAKIGLAQTHKASQARSSYQWKLATGYEYSDISREPQAPWSQQYLQLTRFFHHGKTFVHARFDRYDQFETIDQSYSAGIDHRFSDRFYGYLQGETTSNAHFRPRWGVSLGSGFRLNKPDRSQMPVWLTLDAKQARYVNASIQFFNPGLRIEPYSCWAINAKTIIVKPQGETELYGWLTKLEGCLSERYRFNIGYADAPETIAGQTVKTKSIFAGIAVDVTSTLTLQLGYVHDDRQDSYLRQAYHAGISYRF